LHIDVIAGDSPIRELEQLLASGRSKLRTDLFANAFESLAKCILGDILDFVCHERGLASKYRSH
jgi:hypothetical protein